MAEEKSADRYKYENIIQHWVPSNTNAHTLQGIVPNLTSWKLHEGPYRLFSMDRPDCDEGTTRIF